MKTPDLKPCPFCGGEARLVPLTEHDETWYRVHCRKCPADVGRHWWTNKLEAVKALNRRVTDENQNS